MHHIKAFFILNALLVTASTSCGGDNLELGYLSPSYMPAQSPFYSLVHSPLNRHFNTLDDERWLSPPSKLIEFGSPEPDGNYIDRPDWFEHQQAFSSPLPISPFRLYEHDDSSPCSKEWATPSIVNTTTLRYFASKEMAEMVTEHSSSPTSSKTSQKHELSKSNDEDEEHSNAPPKKKKKTAQHPTSNTGYTKKNPGKTAQSLYPEKYIQALKFLENKKLLTPNDVTTWMSHYKSQSRLMSALKDFITKRQLPSINEFRIWFNDIMHTEPVCHMTRSFFNQALPLIRAVYRQNGNQGIPAYISIIDADMGWKFFDENGAEIYNQLINQTIDLPTTKNHNTPQLLLSFKQRYIAAQQLLNNLPLTKDGFETWWKNCKYNKKTLTRKHYLVEDFYAFIMSSPKPTFNDFSTWIHTILDTKKKSESLRTFLNRTLPLIQAVYGENHNQEIPAYASMINEGSGAIWKFFDTNGNEINLFAPA